MVDDDFDISKACSQLIKFLLAIIEGVNWM